MFHNVSHGSVMFCNVLYGFTRFYTFGHTCVDPPNITNPNLSVPSLLNNRKLNMCSETQGVSNLITSRHGEDSIQIFDTIWYGHV